jgi:hypothetical protein
MNMSVAKYALALLGLALAASGCKGTNSPDPQPAADESSASTTVQQELGDSGKLRVLAPISVPVRQLPAVVQATACNIDTVAGAPAATGGALHSKGSGALSIAGWIISNDKLQVPEALSLRLEDRSAELVWQATGSTGVARPDVANSFSNPALVSSGFDARIDVSAVPEGSYHVYVTYALDDVSYACDNGAQVQVVK